MSSIHSASSAPQSHPINTHAESMTASHAQDKVVEHLPRVLVTPATTAMPLPPGVQAVENALCPSSPRCRDQVADAPSLTDSNIGIAPRDFADFLPPELLSLVPPEQSELDRLLGTCFSAADAIELLEKPQAQALLAKCVRVAIPTQPGGADAASSSRLCALLAEYGEQLFDVELSFLELDKAALVSLTSLPQLGALKIADCVIASGALAALERAQGLEDLNLSESKVAAEDIEALGNSPHLQRSLLSLDLRFTGLTPKVVKSVLQLRALEVLNLSGAELDAEALGLLPGMALQRLTIEATPLPEDGIKHIAACDGLEELKVGGTGIDCAGLRHLAKLKELRHLAIEFNAIGDEGAELVATMQQLQSVSLQGTGIGDRGAQALATLPNLDYVNIWDNEVADAGAAALIANPRITEALAGAGPMSSAARADFMERFGRDSLLWDEHSDATEAFAFLEAKELARTSDARWVPRRVNGLKR